ncbi:hypothetical protein ACROYT_G018072 [Oculina patagonica]
MNVSVAPLRAVCIWKRKRNWPCFLLLLLAAFLGVAYYTTGPVFMENAKDAIELTQNNIAFVMQLDEGRVKDVERFVYRFKQCLASICQHSSIGLTIHIFANSMGKRESTKVLQVLAPNCFNGMKDAIEVGARTHKGTTGALYYLPIFMDRILPEDIARVILLDADFFFFTDIKQLFDQFDNFKETTIFGLALVQQPTYKVGFAKYREEHPGTKIGDPPPDGVTGYNGGLSMLHLTNMRRSKLYKHILLNNEMKKYAEKYQFRGTRREQDFFVLLDAEHHEELFYVVPCQWNRQLCRPRHVIEEVDYDLYRNCSKPIHAYHINCKRKMPTIDNPYQFD